MARKPKTNRVERTHAGGEWTAAGYATWTFPCFYGKTKERGVNLALSKLSTL